MTALEFFNKNNSSTRNFEGGSLCIWGSWFGRPMDNFHILETVTFDEELNILTLIFGNGEHLTIWNAEHISEKKGHFQILQADKILWQWYYNGKPQTKENLLFEEYEYLDGKITLMTNINWFKKDNIELSSKKPAVSMS